MDTAQTADTATPGLSPSPDACEVFVGGGCLGPRDDPSCAELPTEGCEEQEGHGCTSEPEAITAWVGGGGGGEGCSTAAGPAPLALACLALLWLRRLAPVALLGLAVQAHAVDVQHLQWLDGGPLPGVVDPELGEPWSGRWLLGGSHLVDPVRSRSAEGYHPLVQQLDTIELSGSLQLRDWMRVGVSLPGQRVSLPDDDTIGPGDVSAFLVVPMRPRTALLASVDLAHRGSPAFTSQPSTAFGLVATHDVGPLALAGQARIRAQRAQQLPGVRWGPRLELLGGLHTRGALRLGGTVSIGAPLWLITPAPGAWPIEVLGVGSARLAPGARLEIGAGTGLTHGLGSPAARLLAALRIQTSRSDRDGDGLGDLRDLCPNRPEDLDHFRDGDGCPERDNDRDGLADPIDACPDEAEVFNELDDADGCPDALSRLRITVSSAQELEQLWIGLDGEGSVTLSPRHDAVLRPGPHHLEIEAEGHHRFDQILEVPPGPSEVTIRLQPLRHGVVRVRLQDPTGAPLAGSLQLVGATHPIDAGGTQLVLPSGSLHATARAEGHLPEVVALRIPAQDVVDRVVILEPRPDHAQPDPVHFALDSATLRPEATELLDALASWLAAHPGVQLLRIEGHADALGGSAYNHALSVRRAEAVRDALVHRGIAATRLDPVGSGEARQVLIPSELPPSFSATVAGTPARDVTFRVLVWDEAALEASAQAEP